MTGGKHGGSGPPFTRDTRSVRLERAFRMQVFTGNALLALGIFLFIPLPTPSLWLLDDWGGLELPPFFFPTIFVILGVMLSRTRNVWLAMCQMIVAFPIAATIGAAAYLSLGWNGFTVLCLVWLWHIGRTVIDLKGVLREVQSGVRPFNPEGGRH